MSVVATIGIPENESDIHIKRYGSIKGNGKTMFTVYLGALEYTNNRRIFSNFHTSFSEYMSVASAINKIQSEKIMNAVIMVSEMHLVLSNFEKVGRKKFYGEYVRQIRKYQGDLLYDTQRYMDILKTLRDETEFTFTPEKYHFDDDSLCPVDGCNRHHYIKVTQLKPYFTPLYNHVTGDLLKIDCEKIGQLYDTKEIILTE
jgi:hypothetical protein